MNTQLRNEKDALSAAAGQIAAWKERLEMNTQLRNEEDALSAAAAQLAAWKERLEMNVVISPTCNTCGATHSTEGCPFANDGAQYTEQYNYLQQNDIQPKPFPSNIEPNPRHDERAQCPSVTIMSEVQPEPQSQNADELISFSSSSPDPNPMMPTPPSLFK
ncbi:hypothetical protein ACLOJK_034438 [Asimina triloba]